MNELLKQIQYVYLDIVKFTQNRPVEDQAFVIAKMNAIVKESIKTVLNTHSETILLPTGDGLAIAIVKPEYFDIGIALAGDIIDRIGQYNSEASDDSKKFKVRVGINQNVDNIITDINDRQNVAGRGINQAHRLMGCADELQVIVGSSIYEILCERQDYLNSFKKFNAKDKHKKSFEAFQYVGTNFEHINKNTPSRFIIKAPEEEKIPELLSCIIAVAHTHQEYFISKTAEIYCVDNNNIIIYLIAKDVMDQRKLGPHDTRYRKIETSIDTVWRKLESSFRPALNELTHHIESEIGKFSELFESIDYSTALFLPKAAAMENTKKLHPDIWKFVETYQLGETNNGKA